MELQQCAKCKKRPAVVFITRLENGKSINEGLCLVCAKQLGIKPINDMLSKMGVADEDLENISGEVEGMLSAVDDEGMPENGEDGGAPAVDLGRVFGGMPFPFMNMKDKGDRKSSKSEKGKGKEKEEGKKFLSTYCTNLNAKAMSGQIDRMIGRERELARVIQILSRRQKNNPGK